MDRVAPESTFPSVSVTYKGKLLWEVIKIGKSKWNYNNVKLYVSQNSECKLLETSYLGYTKNMKFKCRCGNSFEVTWKKFTTQTEKPKRECNNCTNKKLSECYRVDIKDVIIYVRENSTCKLLSEKYTNAHQKLSFECKCGEKFTTSFDEFKNQNRRQCKPCGYNKNSGDSHYKYNQQLTTEERTLRRYGLYGQGGYNWTLEVYKKDHYRCTCCGNKPRSLNAHHLDGYNWCKEKRFDVENGVTLCMICHKAFHKVYGYGNNTKQQFDEFLIEYKK